MAIRNILKIGDQTLRKPSREVSVINKRVHDLLDDMAATMYEAQGCGLAAPQVGILKRLFVADTGEGLIEMINPVIVSRSGEQTDEEGCLSIPERRDLLTRPMYVTVEAIDRHGKPFTMKAAGMMARCICHETDHLDGVLFVDYKDGKA